MITLTGPVGFHSADAVVQKIENRIDAKKDNNFIKSLQLNLLLVEDLYSRSAFLSNTQVKTLICLASEIPTSEETGVAEVFIMLRTVELIFIATSWLMLATIQVGLNHCAFDFSTLGTINIRSQHNFVGTTHSVSGSWFDHD
jgi:hypothetical protein